MVDQKTQRDWWKHISGVLVALQTGALVVSVYLLQQQTKDIENSKSTRSIEFILKFDERLGREPYINIRAAVESDKPILKNHGGKFTEDELEGFLNIYETLSAVYYKGLIPKDLLFPMYSHEFQKTFGNREIQEYLKLVRKEDPSFYNGSESLAKSMKEESPPPTPTP